jgi:hypothetical protein
MNHFEDSPDLASTPPENGAQAAPRPDLPPPAPPDSSPASPSRFVTVALTALLLALAAGALTVTASHEWTLYYGDAGAHLNIARRVFDSRTPGWEQVGTVWLPLPHLLMMPFAASDALWRSGLAGAIPAAACFVLAGLWFYGAAWRVFSNLAAGAVAALVLALNPNLLYLSATPMTEPILLACLAGWLYAAVRFHQTRSLAWAAAGGLALLAASLTRYEGWALIPFAALFYLFAGRRNRWTAAMLFTAIAALGPLYWLFHNWYYFGDMFEFYQGPYSAQAIYQRSLDRGMRPYPGDHDAPLAVQYLLFAGRACLGWGATIIGALGLLAAIWKRFWPALFLLIPPVFYAASIYSSGTPIFLPELPPYTFYNTRYGLALLPLAAFAAGALVAAAPASWRARVSLLVLVACLTPWLAEPQPGAWITWREAEVNSRARRVWTAEAAAFLKQQYRPGSGIYTSFGALTGIFQQAGIPLAETLHRGNYPQWQAATSLPELFLREEWAVAFSDDEVGATIDRLAAWALRDPASRPYYECVHRILPPGGPVVEIFKRRR